MDILELPLPDLLEEVVLVLGPEGVVALENHEQEHSETPQVCVDGDMIAFGYDFGSHVGGSTAEGVDGGRRGGLEAEAEIDEFELFVSVKQNVFGFDVPMDDVALVQVLNRFCDCLEELFGL